MLVKNNSKLVEINFNSTDKGSLENDKAALTDIQKLILSTFKFTTKFSLIQSYESDYMTLDILSGWKIKPVNKKSTVGTCVNKTNCTYKTKTEVDSSAVNITKDNYILYINTRAKQTSGIIGGRLGEILIGAPSYDALGNSNATYGCGDMSVNVPGISNTSLGLSRVDLYVTPYARCDKVPDKNTTWYASYFTDGVGYFNHTINRQAPDGYAITLSYNSRDVSKLPKGGSKELNTMLQEMTDMIATLQLK